MTKRCKHKWEQKPDYPEDIICRKCETRDNQEGIRTHPPAVSKTTPRTEA